MSVQSASAREGAGAAQHAPHVLKSAIDRLERCQSLEASEASAGKVRPEGSSGLGEFLARLRRSCRRGNNLMSKMSMNSGRLGSWPATVC